MMATLFRVSGMIQMLENIESVRQATHIEYL